VKLDQVIDGPHLQLRTATADDAGFILDLRLDPVLSKHIGETDPSVEKQRIWLQERMDMKDDYHMIIETPDGDPLGLIALYSIDTQDKTFEWGRWIVKPTAPKYTAVESALLCYGLGFEILGLEKSVFGVMKDNARTLSFHKKFGASLTHEETDSIWFEFTKTDFKAATKKFSRFVKSH
jgi:RimJ/RimL family protein N-acetyltransferase